MAYDRTLGPSPAPTGSAATSVASVTVVGGVATAEDLAGLATSDDLFAVLRALQETLSEQTRVLRSIDKNIAVMMGGFPAE